MNQWLEMFRTDKELCYLAVISSFLKVSIVVGLMEHCVTITIQLHVGVPVNTRNFRI